MIIHLLKIYTTIIYFVKNDIYIYIFLNLLIDDFYNSKMIIYDDFVYGCHSILF